MSLNNIQLKPSLLADLYKKSLLETNTGPAPDTKQLKWLGNNDKNILVVVAHQSVPYLPDQELSFLTNVLAACKLSLADIGIINHCKTEQADLQNLINSQAKTILLFGVEPPAIGLPINFPPFQLQPFNNRTYLHTPALSLIEDDKGLKARLWSALKVMFGI